MYTRKGRIKRIEFCVKLKLGYIAIKSAVNKNPSEEKSQTRDKSFLANFFENFS
jgi:hypothetical protein